MCRLRRGRLGGGHRGAGRVEAPWCFERLGLSSTALARGSPGARPPRVVRARPVLAEVNTKRPHDTRNLCRSPEGPPLSCPPPRAAVGPREPPMTVAVGWWRAVVSSRCGSPCGRRRLGQALQTVSAPQRRMPTRRRSPRRAPRTNRRRDAASPTTEARRESTPRRSSRRQSRDRGRWGLALGRAGRFLLRVGAVTGLVYGGLAGVRSMQAYATTSPRFEVRALIYEPTPHVSDDRLRELLALPPGTNCLSLDLTELGARVAAHPWVARAVVTRHLPDTIEVRITEHDAAAAVLAGRFYLADESGRLFKEIEKGERGDLPIVTGLTRDELRADRVRLEQRVASALEIIAAYRAKRRPRLSEVHLDTTGDVTLYTAEAGTQIELGRGQVAERLARFDALRAALDDKADRLSAVYVDSVAAPGRTTRVAARFISEADEQVFIAARSAPDALPEVANQVSDDAGSPVAELGKYKRRIPRYE
ncbi:MAG: FtsQ-type POTRA domain-containing protein [Myxococcales bacterium FL481]|nr:MAG: FtsQ-type POTRA domain-containing protein [Myxococcales bacterium FL481]